MPSLLQGRWAGPHREAIVKEPSKGRQTDGYEADSIVCKSTTFSADSLAPRISRGGHRSKSENIPQSHEHICQRKSVFSSMVAKIRSFFFHVGKVHRATSYYYKTLWHHASSGGQSKRTKQNGETTEPTWWTVPNYGCFTDDIDERHCKLHLFYLAVVLDLWSTPFYRTTTLQQDLLDNLCNVAVPGTGIRLSYFCHFRWTAILFLVLLNPPLCVIGACCLQWTEQRGRSSRIATCYEEMLLAPTDWFNLWRMNCAVAALHYSVTGSPDYNMENKWAFLKKATQCGVPVTPSIGLNGESCSNQAMKAFAGFKTLVVKDINAEGGLGIHFYKNAAHDGDWLIQEKLENSRHIAHLLPENAPLSTFRVLTISRLGMVEQSSEWGVPRCDVEPLTCVFRAGRKGHKTDHTSIFYNVCIDRRGSSRDGKITRGSLNSHWYQPGLSKLLRGDRDGCWTRSGVFARSDGFEAASETGFRCHPDTGKLMVGETIPAFEDILRVCVDAHRDLCPNVPLVGWDVALVDADSHCTLDQDVSGSKVADCPPKPILLEANLSCNFFLGDFNRAEYLGFLEEYTDHLVNTVNGTHISSRHSSSL